MRDVDLKFGLIPIFYIFLLSSYNGWGPVTSGSVIIVGNAVQFHENFTNSCNSRAIAIELAVIGVYQLPTLIGVGLISHDYSICGLTMYLITFLHFSKSFH